MKRKHALKGILFILPALQESVYSGCFLMWMDPQIFLGAVNGVFTGFMNYQMIFSNRISSFRKYLMVFRNLYSVTGGFVTGSCWPANGLGENQKQLMKTAFLLPMAIPVASVAILMESTLMDRAF